MKVGIAALSKWQEYCALSGTPASSLVSLRILFNAEGVKSFPEKYRNTGFEQKKGLLVLDWNSSNRSVR